MKEQQAINQLKILSTWGLTNSKSTKKALEIAIEALKARIPAEPNEKSLFSGECSECGEIVVSGYRYCPECGQRILWGTERGAK